MNKEGVGHTRTHTHTHTHTMEYYLFKKKEILPLSMMWMALKGITLSKRSQTAGQITYDLIYMRNLSKKTIAKA